jgi:plasmid stability protein
MSQLYVRLPDDIHSKLRVIAALKSESLNTTMLTASARYVEDWERKHGELPTPPQEERGRRR